MIECFYKITLFETAQDARIGKSFITSSHDLSKVTTKL